MATFEAKKLDLTQINGGQKYEQGDFLQSDTINDVVEGTAYAQNVAEAANTKSNNAVSTANSANNTANAASAKVDTFEQRITTAQNTADTAVSNAATAQNTADNATTEINKIKNGTTVVPNANHANNADNANMATKAQQDVNGNPINTTYATLDFVTEKQGTRVKVNNANVAELSFTSDPQTQIDNVSNFAVPSSVTGTSRDSGLWVIAVGGSGGAILLGTFLVYDTNISLHISGGIATSAGDSTTDVDVFISTANYVVNKAEYYVRHIYTNQLSGLYYTLDDSHYLRVFADIPEYGKFFIRAEVAGGTIAGRGSTGLQYPSGGAYLVRKNYADLGQVVRVDAAQSLTDEQKQQAQKNIELQGNATLTTPAWYKIATISAGYIAKIIRVKLTTSWNTDRPFSAEATIAIAANTYSETTITTVGNFGHPVTGQSNIFSKIRLNGSNVEVYYNTSNSHTCKFELENYDHNNANITVYDFETTSQSEESGSCFVCDFVNGINTSGGVYQQGAPVFATDPSKLAPSTANGWTQTTATGTLPSAGVYLCYWTSGDARTGLSLLVFDGTNNALAVVPQIYDGEYTSQVLMYEANTGNSRWTVRSGHSVAALSRVYYKRIA